MKSYSKLVALYAFHPSVWGATAFFVQTPKALTFSRQPTDAHASVALHESTYRTVDGNIVSIVESEGAGGGLAADTHFAKKMDSMSPLVVQGGALRTFSFPTPDVKRVLVSLTTEPRFVNDKEGRHIMANVKLCQGPDNTPHIMDIVSGKGLLRPVKVALETPGGHSSIFVRNTGELEYPIKCCVAAEMDDIVDDGRLYDMTTQTIVQGGTVRTYDFEPQVSSVRVVLKTDGRPLNARIELIQGPNANKVTFDVYTEDGLERPFFSIIESPGSGNVVRIVNTATMEFPLTACVEPYVIDAGK